MQRDFTSNWLGSSCVSLAVMAAHLVVPAVAEEGPAPLICSAPDAAESLRRQSRRWHIAKVDILETSDTLAYTVVDANTQFAADENNNRSMFSLPSPKILAIACHRIGRSTASHFFFPPKSHPPAKSSFAYAIERWVPWPNQSIAVIVRKSAGDADSHDLQLWVWNLTSNSTRLHGILPESLAVRETILSLGSALRDTSSEIAWNSDGADPPYVVARHNSGCIRFNCSPTKQIHFVMCANGIMIAVEQNYSIELMEASPCARIYATDLKTNNVIWEKPCASFGSGATAEVYLASLSGSSLPHNALPLQAQQQGANRSSIIWIEPSTGAPIRRRRSPTLSEWLRPDLVANASATRLASLSHPDEDSKNAATISIATDADRVYECQVPKENDVPLLQLELVGFRRSGSLLLQSQAKLFELQPPYDGAIILLDSLNEPDR